MELATDLSEKSIKKYFGAILKINNDMLHTGFSTSSLDEIRDIEKLDKLKKDYFLIEQNKDLDSRGNGMYSAAFNKFIQYKSSKDSRKINKEGIVYLIANPSMPGLVKLGKTIKFAFKLM